MTHLLLQSLRLRSQPCFTTALQPTISLLQNQPGPWGQGPSCSTAHDRASQFHQHQPRLPYAKVALQFMPLSAQQMRAQMEELRRVFKAPPKSLALPPSPPQDLAEADMLRTIHTQKPEPTSGVGKVLSSFTGMFAGKQAAWQGGFAAYTVVCDHVDDGAMCRTLGLDPNVFYNTWVLLAVHIWLILNRLEKDDSRLGKAWKKRVYDLWQEDLRHRMYSAGVQIHLNKWMKRLEQIWFSTVYGFSRVMDPTTPAVKDWDKIVFGDEGPDNTKPLEEHEVYIRMEQVIYREFFNAEFKHKVQSELLTKYMMQQRACLQLTPREDVLAGRFRFDDSPFLEQRQLILAEVSRQRAKAAAEASQ